MYSRLISLALFLLSGMARAASVEESSPILAPQPTACVVGQFTSTGSKDWRRVSLTLSNQCGREVDFQNAALSFLSSTPLETSFWGTFYPLPYPDNSLLFTSQEQADRTHLVSASLHFPSYDTADTKLPAGRSIQIQYGVRAITASTTLSQFISTQATQAGPSSSETLPPAPMA